MIHEIKNLIWLETPKGQGIAKFLIDYGIESSLQWVVFINDTGECWTFTNEDIRACENITLGVQRSKETIVDALKNYQGTTK